MKLKEQIRKTLDFLKVSIWKEQTPDGIRGFGHRTLRVILITVKEFNKDKLVLKASAVTYLSILSVVPIIATVFGITKGFGLEISIEDILSDLVPGQEVVWKESVGFAQKMLDNAKGGVIAGISVGVLLFTVMRLLNNVEDVFNSIWGKQRGRTWMRKFADYLAIIIIAPILIVMSSSLTALMTTQLDTITAQFEWLDLIAPSTKFLVEVSSYFLIWLLFTLIYLILPNTKVKFISAAVGGIIAGAIFTLVQWGFIKFQIGVASNNAIYGTLAALPLFFIFTQLSWTIVFIGGELSYAVQSVDTYIPDEKNIKFSESEKKKIAMGVVKAVAQKFEKGDDPFTKRELSDHLGVPHRFVSDAVNRLVNAHILTRSRVDEKDRHVYLPSLDIDKLDVHFVTHRLDETGEHDLFTKNGEFQGINESMKNMEAQLAKSKDNKLLKDI